MFKTQSLLNSYLMSGVSGRSFGAYTAKKYNIHRRQKMMYPCLPQWQKVEPRDPFDYKLRSKEEVKEDFRMWEPDFSMFVHYKRYTAGDTRQNDDNNRDNRERVAKVRLDIRDLKLAPLQRQRFQYLMGPRWSQKKPHFLKIVMSRYNTFHENYIKAMETLREIYWEAKRAPTIQSTMQKNPYRRQWLIRKFFGATKEERKQTRLLLRKASVEYKKQVDTKTMDEELALAEQTKVRSLKNRSHAQLRAKLGYRNESEEVEDPVLDRFEFDMTKHEKALAESLEKKPVKIVTDVEGISKEEYVKSMLKDKERFREV